MQLLIRIESSTISKDIRRHRFLVPHCHDEKGHSRSECAHLSSSEAGKASVPYLFHPQEEINCSQRTLYNYINQRYFPAVMSIPDDSEPSFRKHSTVIPL